MHLSLLCKLTMKRTLFYIQKRILKQLHCKAAQLPTLLFGHRYSEWRKSQEEWEKSFKNHFFIQNWLTTKQIFMLKITRKREIMRSNCVCVVFFVAFGPFFSWSPCYLFYTFAQTQLMNFVSNMPTERIEKKSKSQNQMGVR